MVGKGPHSQLRDETSEKLDSQIPAAQLPGSESNSVPSSDRQENEETRLSGGALRERTIHGWKWVATAASLYIGAMIYGLDGTIVADIQPDLIEQFNEIESITWAGTGFPLGSFCSILPG